MKSRYMLAALALIAAAAGAQQKPVQQKSATQTVTAKAAPARPAPAVSADSAKAIVLSHISGAKVASEKLQTRNGHRYYLFTLREPNRRAVVRATVDASSGSFSRLDKTANP